MSYSFYRLRTPLVGFSVDADATEIEFTDYAGTLTRDGSWSRIVRPIDTADQGDSSHLKYAAPGARARFQVTLTAPGVVEWPVDYDGLMTLAAIYNGVGVLLENGSVVATFDLPKVGGVIQTGQVTVAVLLGIGTHILELVLPYCASVRVGAPRVPRGALIESAPARPSDVAVLIGDSRLNGGAATDITGTIGFQLGEILDMQVINLANGGRQLSASDFTVAGALAPDVTFSLFDFNNFYPNGNSIVGFEAVYEVGITNYRTAVTSAGAPTSKLRVITSFASTSDADWGGTPGPYIGNSPTLEQHRQAERNAVADTAAANTAIVEGRGVGMPTAIAANTADGIHYNSAAQAVMATVLAASV